MKAGGGRTVLVLLFVLGLLLAGMAVQMGKGRAGQLPPNPSHAGR
jgi:hypothetical protein